MEFDARSLLFIPADAERFIAKGAERGADAIIEAPNQLEQLDSDLAREEHYAGRPKQAVRVSS